MQTEDEKPTARLDADQAAERIAETRADTLHEGATHVAAPWRRGVELAEGEVVAGWTIDRLLGRGGMGAVYAGHDPATGARAAIKLLQAGADARAAERFRREGVAQAAVDRHANVVRVLASAEHRGAAVLVMELAEGGDLAARLAKGPLPAGEAVGLVAQLARGLAHVHARGVLHRDLKPHNVLFDEQGTPKLVDFGVARLRGEGTLTKTGEMIGTPAYMSPEQADGQRGAIDERTDVYGLGAVLYHAVTGKAPFAGAAVHEVVRKVLLEAPPAPSSSAEGLPPDLDRVVLKAMAKDPGDRYPSARAMAEDLERLARGESVEAQDAAGARRRLRGLGLVLGAAALVAGGVALWRTWPRLSAYLGTPDAPAAFVVPTGRLRAVHGKTTTRLGWVTVEGEVEGDARAARVTVGGRPTLEATAGQVTSAVRIEGRAPLALGANTLRLEAQRADDARWVTLATVSVERDARYDPAPPERVVDRRGREILLDEATEEYRAHDGSVLVYVPVPAGTFEIGSTECTYRMGLGGERWEDLKVSEPVHRVRLTRPFLLGKHEVAQRQVDAWLPEAKLQDGPRHGEHWRPEYPAVDVIWEEARAYCAWAGLELPTETQWEWAARGPAGSRFPWGNQDPRQGVHARFNARGRPFGGKLGPLPVDDATLRDVSWVGAMHLAGNMAEWTQDLFAPTYSTRIESGCVVDPVWPQLTEPLPPYAHRVMRGGSWFEDEPATLHAAGRRPERADLSGGDEVRDHDQGHIGFRVALTLESGR